MPEKKLICLECNKRVANSNNVLGRHVRASHGIEWSDYIVKHEFGGTWPICECGCGERLPWRKGGFNTYIKGHDIKEKRVYDNSEVVIYDKGWVPNPFTGREEHMDTDEDAAFLEACVKASDPVTKDHGFKIGWEDSSGVLHIYTPGFKHLRNPIIFVIDDFSDNEGNRRYLGVKEWCNQHRYIAVLMQHDGKAFNVIGWYKPDGMEVGDVPQAVPEGVPEVSEEEAEQGEVPDGAREEEGAPTLRYLS